MNQDKYFDGMKACSCDRRYAPVYVRSEGKSYVFCRSCRRRSELCIDKSSAIKSWNESE
jgi:hypothetical protein